MVESVESSSKSKLSSTNLEPEGFTQPKPWHGHQDCLSRPLAFVHPLTLYCWLNWHDLLDMTSMFPVIRSTPPLQRACLAYNQLNFLQAVLDNVHRCGLCTTHSVIPLLAVTFRRLSSPNSKVWCLLFSHPLMNSGLCQLSLEQMARLSLPTQKTAWVARQTGSLRPAKLERIVQTRENHVCICLENMLTDWHPGWTSRAVSCHRRTRWMSRASKPPGGPKAACSASSLEN